MKTMHEIRKEKNITMKRICTETAISPVRLTHIEMGAVTPTIEEKKMICEVLGVDDFGLGGVVG